MINKKQQIGKLKLEIENIKFKIEAQKLKLKLNTNPCNPVIFAIENLKYMMQLRSLLFQIQVIQSQPIPNFKKGAVIVVGNIKKEMITKISQ